MIKGLFKILVFSVLLLFISCSNNEKLTINGKISGGVGDTLTIKHLVNNQLKIVDSKVLKSNGQFNFNLEKKVFPEYYFLQINNGNQLVLIRDSFDLISINAEAKALEKAAIEGSVLSERIQRTMQKVKILRAEYIKYDKAFMEADAEEQKALVDEILLKIKEVKGFIGEEIYKEPRSYYSYFALFQRISNDNLLFSPYNEEDYRYFAAVATAYDVFQKEDPRTKALYDMVNNALVEKRKVALQKMIDEAPGGVPDIVMNDHKDVERKLSDFEGKVVILNFWASVNQESRSFNKELLKLYNKYKSKGVTVFQVSVDKSKIYWQEAIAEDNLPWTNVCDFKSGASQPVVIYNVKELPTTYIVGRDGELKGRYATLAELENAIKECL